MLRGETLARPQPEGEGKRFRRFGFAKVVGFRDSAGIIFNNLPWGGTGLRDPEGVPCDARFAG
jgi:hypothetical protein